MKRMQQFQKKLQTLFEPQIHLNEPNVQSAVKADLADLINCRFHADKIDLRPKRRIATQLAGGHISAIRGRGIDFEEVRTYLPGDDIRHMDWRVTARTGRPHCKVYREERERPVYIVVDCGPNMFFGTRTRFKSVMAAHVAALLAWAAAKNGDRIGSILFASDNHFELRPRNGQRGVLPLLKALSDHAIPIDFTPNPQAFELALQRLRHVARPGSLIFILSDFLHLNKKVEYHLGQLTKHCEILGGLVYDPLEKSPPQPDRYLVSDGEKFSTIDTNSKSFRDAYRQIFTMRHAHLKDLLGRRRIPLLEFPTNEDPFDCLLRYLGRGK